MKDPTEEISLTQASLETGLTRQAFHTAIKGGRLPAVLEEGSELRPEGSGRMLLITRSDLDVYLATRAKGRAKRVADTYVPSVSWGTIEGFTGEGE